MPSCAPLTIVYCCLLEALAHCKQTWSTVYLFMCELRLLRVIKQSVPMLRLNRLLCFLMKRSTCAWGLICKELLHYCVFKTQLYFTANGDMMSEVGAAAWLDQTQAADTVVQSSRRHATPDAGMAEVRAPHTIVLQYLYLVPLGPYNHILICTTKPNIILR